MSNDTDADDYSDTIGALYEKLLEQCVPPLDKETVKSTLKEAQQTAIKIAQNNINDCPFGTTEFYDNFGILSAYRSAVGSIDMNATENVDWAGTSRSGDYSRISMQTMVELTLYCFDKLLYKKLAA